MKNLCLWLTAAVAVAATGACNKPGSTNDASANGNAALASTNAAAPGDPIASAESAAPASIAHDASIVTMDAGGKATTLRQGKNGWTCIPDAPDTPRPDPPCIDLACREHCQRIDRAPAVMARALDRVGQGATVAQQ